MRAEIISSTNDPLQYPWSPPDRNVFVTGFGARSVLRLLNGRRMSHCQIINNDGFPESDSYFLRRLRQVSLSDRYLVVAVGSNADPEVMCNKFSQRGCDTSLVFPLIKCRIENIKIGLMTSVTPRGYVAATPYEEQGSSSTVWAALLDRKQFLALDSTEPGYSCKQLSSIKYPLRVLNESGKLGEEIPEFYYIYEAETGFVSDLGSFDLGEAGSLTQRQVIKEVCEYLRNAEHTHMLDVEEATSGELREFIVSKEYAEAYGKMCAQRNLIHSPNLEGTICLKLDEDDYSMNDRQCYKLSDNLNTQFVLEPKHSSFVNSAHRLPGLRVVGTSDSLFRHGELCCTLNPKYQSIIGSHGGLVACVSGLNDRPPVLCRVTYDEDLGEDVIAVDQVLRDGLGICIGESAAVMRCQPAKSRFADLICGRKYVALRTQSADHSTMETDSILVDSLTLSFLGIADGEDVVIEGAPRVDGSIPQVRLPATAINDTVRERRVEAFGGGLDDLYADAEHALGVYPDLLPLMADSAIRHSLGLGVHRLVPVRVRASRRAKFVSELRELLLIMFIALIGVVTVVDSVLLLSILLGLLLLASLVVNIVRVRAAIGLSRRRPPKPSAFQED